MSDFKTSIDNATATIVMELVKNVEKSCLVLEREAKKNCPVDQGQLRASITHTSGLRGNKIVGIIGTNLKYAPYVHQGTGVYAKNGDGRKTPWVYVSSSGKYKGGHTTSGQKPQPFLEDATKTKKVDIERILGGK